MGELLWKSYYFTIENLHTFSKTTSQYALQPSRKVYSNEELGIYFKEEKEPWDF